MAARTFISPDGTVWQAWNVNPGEHAQRPVHARLHLPESMTAGWLCFESEFEKRRLHPIPPGWEDHSEEQLWTFCLEAQPVVRRMTNAA